MTTASIDLWEDRALAIARLGRVTVHAHAASAMLVGIDGAFGFRVGRTGERWQRVEHIVVAAGCPHELDCGDTRMGVLYLTPGRIDHRQLCSHAELEADAELHVLGPPRHEREALTAIAVGELEGESLDAWIARQIGPSPRRMARDPRVEAAASLIRDRSDTPCSLASLAAHAGLSPSRLQHLFLDEVGATPRQLRTWQRLREVTRLVAEGSSLTRAAHDSGFVDSAHLSKSFRQLFGLPPSRVLTGGTRMRVHGTS